MTATALHLHCPGLLGPLPAEAVDLVGLSAAGAALALLLSRGKLAGVGNVPDPDRRRLSLFGLSVTPEQGLPVGPLSMLGEGVDPGQSWIFRADPVHLHPDRDRLLVLDPGRLALPSDNVADLVRSFNDLFAEDGLTLEAPHSDRWYLRVQHVPALHTTPLDRVMGRPMGDCLPTGKDALRWITHLNAMQMLLHESPLNRQREAEGRRPINGIWLWGGGRLPTVPDSSTWAQIYSDVMLVKGLARHMGVPLAPVPDPLDLLEKPSAGMQGPTLVDIGCFPAVQDGESFQDWESALNAFALEWAIPLLEALRAGRLQRLVLDLGTRRWELTPMSLRLLWRRRKPLKTWLEHGEP